MCHLPDSRLPVCVCVCVCSVTSAAWKIVHRLSLFYACCMHSANLNLFEFLTFLSNLNSTKGWSFSATFSVSVSERKKGIFCQILKESHHIHLPSLVTWTCHTLIDCTFHLYSSISSIPHLQVHFQHTHTHTRTHTHTHIFILLYQY